MTVAEYVRLVGAEFASVSDETIDKWIEFCTPMVSKKLFGKLYERALALLVCHKMKLTTAGEGSADGNGGGLGNIDDMLRIGSYSEGGVSISYSVSGQALMGTDGEYQLTLYGIEYLKLKRSCIVPIRIRGEGLEFNGRFFWH